MDSDYTYYRKLLASDKEKEMLEKNITKKMDKKKKTNNYPAVPKTRRRTR